MKKAKIILTALTVITIVGGALAFKAQQKFDGDLRCTEVPGGAPCDIIAFNGGPSPLFCTAKTSPAPCVDQFNVEVNP